MRNRTISKVMKSQANFMFKQKKQQVIQNTLKQISERTGKSFNEVLEIYMSGVNN